MTEKIKNIVIIIGIVLLLAVFVFSKIYSCNKSSVSNTATVHDTTVINNYITKVETDTVIKWYEKIVYKQTDPTVIYQQKTDSVFLESVKYLDLIPHLSWSGGNLTITTVNINDSIVKEWHFENIYNGYTVTSQEGNLFIKNNLFGYNGAELFARLSSQFNNDSIKNPNVTVGVKTGWNFQNSFSLTPGISYQFRNPPAFKNFNFELELNYKFLK